MPCCFVPAFQVKDRSERTERKVSTALFLHGDWVFSFQGRQWGLEIWSLSCFALQTDSHSQSSACLCLFFLQINSPSPPPESFFATCTQPHKTLHHNHILWKPQRYVRLACSSQVINMGNTSFICSGEWVTLDEVIALYTCLLYLSSLHSHSFFSTVYIPLNSVCSFYWLPWNR